MGKMSTQNKKNKKKTPFVLAVLLFVYQKATIFRKYDMIVKVGNVFFAFVVTTAVARYTTGARTKS